MPGKVLIVEDDPEMCQLLGLQFQSKGYQAEMAGSGGKAVECLKREPFDLVVTDMVLPGGLDGLAVLREAKRLHPAAEVILITVYGLELAATAIKAGAYDMIQKPFAAEQILSVAERALDKRELKTLLAIQEACAAVLTAPQGAELMPRVVDLALKVLGAHDVSLMLAGPDGRLRVAASSGAADEERRRTLLPMGERVAGRVAALKEPVIINGPLEKDSRFAGITGFRPIQSSIVYPVTVGPELLGVLNANRTAPGDNFTARDLRVAGIFVSEIAQALRYARLHDRLEETRAELAKVQSLLQGLLKPGGADDPRGD